MVFVTIVFVPVNSTLETGYKLPRVYRDVFDPLNKSDMEGIVNEYERRYASYYKTVPRRLRVIDIIETSVNEFKVTYDVCNLIE